MKYYWRCHIMNFTLNWECTIDIKRRQLIVASPSILITNLPTSSIGRGPSLLPPFVSFTMLSPLTSPTRSVFQYCLPAAIVVVVYHKRLYAEASPALRPVLAIVPACREEVQDHREVISSSSSADAESSRVLRPIRRRHRRYFVSRIRTTPTATRRRRSKP